MRIVSLLPSATEIVCALGLQDNLVGRSHECDYPEGVEQLPICSEPKFTPDGTSYEIDQKVRALVQEGLSVYRIDSEKLQELRPDFIITQSQCEVCAVSFTELDKAVRQLTDPQPEIIDLQPERYEDIYGDIQKTARQLGVPEKGEEVVDDLRTQVQEIEEKAQSTSETPTVVCLEWFDPLMTAGNWMPTVIEKAGGQSCLAEPNEHSGYAEWESVVETDPDVLLLMPCGFDIQQTLNDISTVTERPGWESLTAVQNNRVYMADGHHYFNRPGPRMVDSLRILAEILHPDDFEPSYQEKGWVRYAGQEVGPSLG